MDPKELSKEIQVTVKAAEEKGWAAVYLDIKSESASSKQSCSEAINPVNLSLNRYRDVIPYDHSRVVLKKGTCDYINGNIVEVKKAGKSYILTQGPLPHTTGHFWLMIWEQKSKAIIMLNKIIEKNQIKCHHYWPTDEKNPLSFKEVGITVRLLSEEKYRHFIKRTLSLEYEGSSREVFQFHYITWPDFGIPSTCSAFLTFLQVVRDHGVLDNSLYGPAVVHCSAGIGRSGTFCLVDSCLVMMQNGISVDIREVLLEMRSYRMGLIQTPDQLKFSYHAILEGAEQLANGVTSFLNGEGLEPEHGDKENDPSVPLPPPRGASLHNPGLGSRPEPHFFRKIITDNGLPCFKKPLPDLPDSETDEDDDMEDDDLDSSDDSLIKGSSASTSTDELNEPVSEFQGGFSSKKYENHSLDKLCKVVGDADEDDDDEGIDFSNSSKSHGEPNESELVRNRRAQNKVLREKLLQIKENQKKNEESKGQIDKFVTHFSDKKTIALFLGLAATFALICYMKS